MVEIHNEVVLDVLDVAKGGLNLREVKSRNVSVEHVREETFQSGKLFWSSIWEENCRQSSVGCWLFRTEARKQIELSIQA